MRSKTLAALAVLAACGLGANMPATASGLSDLLGQKPKNEVKAAPPPVADVPKWLRDSERLNSMLGDNADARIEDAKVVRKVETPIPGLDGFVVQATVYSTASPEGKQELFVFYSDKTGRYLVVGMMIDTEKDRDLNQMVERHVRGQLSDNPALALRPQEMHGILLKGGKSKASPLTFVVDLGPEPGKSSLLGLVQLHQSMVAKGSNPRPIRIVLVSAGKDETSTGAMAIAMGFDQLAGDGVARLVEYAQKGRATSWMEPKRLKTDDNLKRAVGMGIFRLDANSSQALQARLDTLPLVYDGSGDKTKHIPLPTSQADWQALLLK